jgi:hypothetical protein
MGGVCRRFPLALGGHRRHPLPTVLPQSPVWAIRGARCPSRGDGPKMRAWAGGSRRPSGLRSASSAGSRPWRPTRRPTRAGRQLRLGADGCSPRGVDATPRAPSVESKVRSPRASPNSVPMIGVSTLEDQLARPRPAVGVQREIGCGRRAWARHAPYEAKSPASPAQRDGAIAVQHSLAARDPLTDAQTGFSSSRRIRAEFCFSGEGSTGAVTRTGATSSERSYTYFDSNRDMYDLEDGL